MMSLLVPLRRFDPEIPEFIDRPDNDPVLLEQDLRNLRLINRLFGGLSALRHTMKLWRLDSTYPDEISILDLGTGSADLPIALSNALTKYGTAHRIEAVDKNRQILTVARKRTEDYPRIHVAEKDIRDLDYPAESFDIVLCSLVLHHFSQPDVIHILQQIDRISRSGFLVNDLNRSWIGAWTAWLFTHATSRNPLTLHDSYLSVLRGFTPEEMATSAREAGIQYFQIRTRPFFRLLLIGQKHA